MIVALLALPLTACGGEKKAPTAKAIKLADYSVTLDAKQNGREIYTENTGYTAANKLNGIAANANSYGITALFNSETQKYTLYDLNNGQTLMSGQEFSNISLDGATGCFKLMNYDAAGNTNKWGVADWTGTKMLMDMTEISAYSSVTIETMDNCYVGNEIYPAEILKIQYTPAARTRPSANTSESLRKTCSALPRSTQ